MFGKKKKTLVETANQIRGFKQELDNRPVTREELADIYARFTAIEQHLNIHVTPVYEKYKVIPSIDILGVDYKTM